MFMIKRDPTIVELLKKSHSFTITNEEVAWAAEMLRQGGGGYHRSTLLEIVGWSGGTEYEELVVPFLENPEDDWLSLMALKILCGYWGLSDKYVEELRRFLAGVPWDVTGGIQLTAISEAGSHLRTHHDDDLLRRLWDFAHERGPQREITDDDIETFGVEGAVEKAASFRSLCAEVAIEALARALGDSYRDITIRQTSQTRKVWEVEVLRRVKEKFGQLD